MSKYFIFNGSSGTSIKFISGNFEVFRSTGQLVQWLIVKFGTAEGTKCNFSYITWMAITLAFAL